MSSSKIRKALGAVKDQTSIGLAKVGSCDSLADLDVAIVKATRHVEQPAEERHVKEILSLTSYSRAYISSCVNTLSRRLSKTRNWVVALKTLVLIQQLLDEGDPAYQQEIFFATRRGTRLLNLADFRDASESNSWDYSAFVRIYALYLDERLEFRMQGRRGKRSSFGIEEEEGGDDDDDEGEAHVNSTPIRDMKIDHIFTRIQHLQQLLDRFLACRPTGVAKHNRVIMVALYPITKESFQLYYDITEILGILIDRFMELEISNSIKVYDIFCRTSKQFDDLDDFYRWCKAIGIARSSEYPEIEKITQKKLDLMDEFIRDKSALEKTKHAITYEQNTETEKEEEEIKEEDDIYSIKALPAPEGFTSSDEPVQEIQQDPKEEETKEVDLLNLSEDIVSKDEHVNEMALALFGGGAITSATSPWEAFINDDKPDWETSLVESASHLSNQKPNLGGGFDTMLLDEMYQQGTSNVVRSSGGSASSVALVSAERPTMLALPAPQTRNIEPNVDPFAASLTIAPPSYVQMSDMEKKQKLLMDEQLMWQQYARDRSGLH